MPKGDTRNPASVEHYTGPEGLANKVDVAKVMESGITYARCLQQPALYVVHRWTGADTACDHLGGLERIHGLFHTVTYHEDFLEPYGKHGAMYSSMRVEKSRHTQKLLGTQTSQPIGVQEPLGDEGIGDGDAQPGHLSK